MKCLFSHLCVVEYCSIACIQYIPFLSGMSQWGLITFSRLLTDVGVLPYASSHHPPVLLQACAVRGVVDQRRSEACVRTVVGQPVLCVQQLLCIARVDEGRRTASCSRCSGAGACGRSSSSCLQHSIGQSGRDLNCALKPRREDEWSAA